MGGFFPNFRSKGSKPICNCREKHVLHLRHFALQRHMQLWAKFGKPRLAQQGAKHVVLALRIHIGLEYVSWSHPIPIFFCSAVWRNWFWHTAEDEKEIHKGNWTLLHHSCYILGATRPIWAHVLKAPTSLEQDMQAWCRKEHPIQNYTINTILNIKHLHKYRMTGFQKLNSLGFSW